MEKVLSDTSTKSEEKIKLIDELRKNNPVNSDRWTIRVAIYILGFIALGTVFSISFLMDIPEHTDPS